MRAVIKSGYGHWEVLELVDVDRPEIVRPHDVPWPTGMNSVPQFLNLRIVLENMGLPLLARDHGARCRQTESLTQAATLFDHQALKVNLAARCSLADAREAHSALESGTHTGRIVLDIPT